ncbi:DUF2913 family protein [Vibrio sp. HN007]|uniref:DUF2913 family protein n=1 Tax=Vibrio iocasae TaxID=3098914 RepID=UPI0035D3EE67
MSAVSTTDNILSMLICHSMLKLYFEIAYSRRFVTPEKRNQCVAKYLKGALKDRKYKSVKSSIRELLHYTRQPSANIEMKLKEVQQIIEVTQVSADEQTDLGKFMSILGKVDKITPLNSEPFDDEAVINPTDAYVDEGFLSDNFDAEGGAINRILLTVPSNKSEEVRNLIRDEGWQCLVSECQKYEHFEVLSLSTPSFKP